MKPVVALREWKDIHQRPGEDRRRCFTNETFELFLFYGPDGAVRDVHLLYLLEGSSLHALLWSPDRGYAHHSVDAGERDGYTHNMGRSFSGAEVDFDKAAVLDRFTRAAGGLEPEVRDLALSIIRDAP